MSPEANAAGENSFKGTIVAVLEVKHKHRLKYLTITTDDVQHHIRILGPLLFYMTL